MLQTLILPFATEEPDRERAFTSEMEKAAILCLAEAKRKKPRILRGAAEEIEYVAKLHYPLWGVPWRDRCIAIDGLGLSSATIIDGQIPDVLDFTEDLERSSLSFDDFRKSLKKHGQTFERFASTREEVAEAVIGAGPVVNALSSLVKQAEKVKDKPRTDAIFLQYDFPKEEAERRAEHFISKWTRARVEVDALQYALQALEEMMDHHKEKMPVEIEQIWGEYEDRISEMKKLVDKRISQLTRRKERETARALKAHNRRLKEALKEEGRIRQKIEELKGSTKYQQQRRKEQKRRYPKRSTSRIDNRIDSYKRKLKDLSRKGRELPELKEDIQKEREASLKMVEEEYLAMASREMGKLEILEQSRNLEVSEKREEVKEAEEASSSIKAQIGRLIEQKKSDLQELERKTLPLKVKSTILIGIPFYLMQYKSSRGTRREICPPFSAASYEGMIKKLQRAVLSFNLDARIQLLLNPRSPELDGQVFMSLKRSLDRDPALREAVSEIALSGNLLELPNFKEEATRGMKELQAEGWLNRDEVEKILSICSG